MPHDHFVAGMIGMVKMAIQQIELDGEHAIIGNIFS